MLNCRRIVILRFLSRVAGKNRSADSDRLNELLIIKLYSFSLQVKAFTRTSASQQSTVIRNMADYFDIFNVEKLWRRCSEARRRRGYSGKSSGAYQREQSCKLCRPQTLVHNCDDRAKCQGCCCPSPTHRR